MGELLKGWKLRQATEECSEAAQGYCSSWAESARPFESLPRNCQVEDDGCVVWVVVRLRARAGHTQVNSGRMVLRPIGNPPALFADRAPADSRGGRLCLRPETVDHTDVTLL